MFTEYKEFCNLFHATTLLPVTYYHAPTDKAYSCPQILGNEIIFKGLLTGFTQFSKNPDYFVSPSFSYFGRVLSKDQEHTIFLGPVFSTPASDFTLRNFMREWAVSPEYRDEIAQFLADTPAVSFSRFLKSLAYLYLCLNGEVIDIDIYFQQNDTGSIHALSGLHSNQVFEAKENRNYHNTYDFERQLMQFVQNGETEHIKALLKKNTNLTAGTLADNALRQEKNIFISSVALTTRSAIAGGMDMEQAYQLSDLYIQEAERTSDISYVSNLQYAMLIDFSERVSQTKIPQGMSQEIFECIQFITHNINDSISVQDVSDHIGRSRSYLSARFKKELGFDLGDFIMQCRLEEAKSLLRYSDKTLSEISSYLCFSSQSYFQNVFKRKYGITPKQYREKARHLESS